MADQDFKINIVTLADLTGIKLTQEQLAALQTAAAAGNKQAIAALKQLTTAEKEAGQAAQQQAREQVQGIRNAAGYGLIIGGVVATAINNLANAQNKVTKELDEQGRLLVKNVLEWEKLAKAATTPEQLAGVGEKAVSQIDALKQKFNEANGEALTLGETVQDMIEKFLKTPLFGASQPGGNEALQAEKLKGLMQDLADAQENAARTVKRGLDQQRDSHEDIDAVIEREKKHLEEQQALLRNLDPKTQLQSWVAVEQTVERITKKLAELNAERDKQAKAGEPTTKAGLLEKQLADLTKAGQRQDLTPAEQEQRSQAEIATREQLFQQRIADREKSMQDAIQKRDDRFTGRNQQQPPSGERQTETNQALLDKLDILIGIWR